MKNSFDSKRKEGLRCVFAVTGGRAPFFHDLSEGEALAPDPRDRENSGGGKFPSQISHRKDQHGFRLVEPPARRGALESKKRYRNPPIRFNVDPQILVRT